MARESDSSRVGLSWRPPSEERRARQLLIKQLAAAQQRRNVRKQEAAAAGRVSYEEFRQREREHIRYLELKRFAEGGHLTPFWYRHPIIVIAAVLIAVFFLGVAAAAPFRDPPPPVTSGHGLMKVGGFERGKSAPKEPGIMAAGYALAVLHLGRLELGETYCPPADMSDEELVKSALRWIHKHPGLWGRPAVHLVEEAVVMLYVCD